jgi:hypothetical protein
MTGMRRLGTPRPVSIQTGPDGVPTAVGSSAVGSSAVRPTAGGSSAVRPSAVEAVEVEAVAEEWVVEDRWWTGRPLKRRYFELILADGRSTTVFRDLRTGSGAAGSGAAGASGEAGAAGTGAAASGRWFSQVG